MKTANLLWLRLDLRLADNPALWAALTRGGAIVPVFIWSPEEEGAWPPGGASQWWLHQSLTALDARLREGGSRLVLRCGATLDTLRALVKETGARAVSWNRRYEPSIIARDAKVEEGLRRYGLTVESYNAALLYEPWRIRNQSGKPFQVFTPFWNHCLKQPDPAEPLSAPKHLPAPAKWPKSLALKELELEPGINWATGMRAAWQPGEAGAAKALQTFLTTAFAGYSDRRNRPDVTGTSRLSPHLHFGEISPRQVWHAVRRREERSADFQSAVSQVSNLRTLDQSGAARRVERPADWKSAIQQVGKPALRDWRASQFLAELGWREFSHHLLYHFPHTPAEPLRPGFKKFPWRKNAAWLKAWQKGRTGYPIVDAGMRELWATGWMHNRVRMIAASFLVKDLLLPWSEGARWFWDTLVDADLAQNTLGWQWTAGCGADAAPYFRVFNPTSQGEKFDPHGDYVRRWCPELAKLPGEWIHQPHEAPPEILHAAGVEPGRTYPQPVVDHALARQAALEAYGRIRSPGAMVRP
jgi:deoxyribodipyrimidine photo-lyase